MRLLTLIFLAPLHATSLLEIKPEVFKETIQGRLVPLINNNFGFNCAFTSTYKSEIIRTVIKRAKKSRQRNPSSTIPFIHPKYPTLTFYAYPLGYHKLIGNDKEVSDYLIFNAEWFAVDAAIRVIGNNYDFFKFCTFLPGTSFFSEDGSRITISQDEAITGSEAGSIDPSASAEAHTMDKPSHESWNSFQGLNYPIIKDVLRHNGLHD